MHLSFTFGLRDNSSKLRFLFCIFDSSHCCGQIFIHCSSDSHSDFYSSGLSNFHTREMTIYTSSSKIVRRSWVRETNYDASFPKVSRRIGLKDLSLGSFWNYKIKKMIFSFSSRVSVEIPPLEVIKFSIKFTQKGCEKLCVWW